MKCDNCKHNITPQFHKNYCTLWGCVMTKVKQCKYFEQKQGGRKP